MNKLKKVISLFSILSLILSIFIPLNNIQASMGITISSQEEFEEGTIDPNLDTTFIPGDLRLKYKNASHIDTTTDDFNLGETNRYIQTSQVMTDKVEIGKSSVYNLWTPLSLGSSYVYGSFLNQNNNLLYINTGGGGLSVINTQGTVNPSDDVLVKTYTTSTTPAIGGNVVYNSSFDQLNNLLYISTYGGLSVINTQGTVDPSDDVLVKTYTTSTTPAIGSNRVHSSFIDQTNNLLYVSTWGGGLSVINTQGTVDPSDDVLVKTYTTSTTPAIGNNSVMNSFLDQTSNLLYVNTYGGLSVINTQGTVNPSDDVLVKTYTTSTTPAIGNNSVESSFLDQTNHLLYVSTYGGGLSVINTQGTVTPTDDTLVKTYTISTTPAIAANKVTQSFLDQTHNLLYVSTWGGGLSVINTQGTVTPTDDTLVKTYTISTTPAIGDNYLVSFSFDFTKNLMYVSTSSEGLFVISLDDIYNNQGTFAKTISGELDSNLWIEKEKLPEVRMGGGSVNINNILYIIGGSDGPDGASLNSLISYNPLSSSWQTLNPMITARNTPVVGVIGNKIYVVGGKGSSGGLNSMEIYDTENNTWTAGPSMSNARIGASGGVYDGKLYIVGGTGETCGINSKTTMEVYDPMSNTWSYKTSAPVVKLISSTAQFINGKMYVAGGQTYCNSVDSNALISYDVESDTWETGLPPIPSSRAGGSSVMLDGKFIYIGGSDYNYNSAPDIYSYDPVTNSWGIISRLPEAITRSMPFIANGNLYVMGGKNIDGNAIDTNYFLSSEYLTDVYQKEKYNNITWNATTPEGTEVEMFYSTDGGNNYTSLGTEAGSYNIDIPSSYDLKYKAVLKTENLDITPSLDDVTISYAQENNGYYEANEGTYISSVLDADSSVTWATLETDQSTPEGTTITYQTRSGDVLAPDESWSLWEDTTGDISSPPSRYLQIKAVLSTTNTETPIIHSITINTKVVPALNTNEATSITQTTATLNGIITNDGGEIPDVGFDYGLNINSYTRNESSLLEDNTFSLELSGLTCGTTYHYRGFAINSIGETDGDDLIFTTTGCDEPPTPTCSDGIQNQNETGIDTGGVCTPPKPRHTSSGSSASAIATFQQEQQARAEAVGLPTTPSTNTPTLVRTLKYKMTGEDVKQLQIYLNTHNYPISLTGAGSLNNETTYFGLKTKQAVIKFQLANGLVGDGVVGPMTRGKMK